MTADDRRIRWLTDLVRVEILLWEHVDARLKQAHDLSLAAFETLFALEGSDTLRIGDLAQSLRITVGGASKLAERVRAAGLIERRPDPGDRRASLIALTAAGRERLTAAKATYDAAVAERLEGVLSEVEQRQMHQLISRILSTEVLQQAHS
ncbi:winged helix-turn-helix transcriptional regulator [Actinoplanes sp. LDG1-06]|uniref:Winged helix-turn-helix transcriptional regulator n=1 Tax=Paractinoplanes ovalisporus TaxID=2810368 RepID=A0ABS2AJC0_9ACTN|nr:MarR family winged helix-turn-helix transcriptional regulator [Actinoplanes ovalisporus]MBM2619921.1 winged helix-turn-helix transcriptional regulator [Actinoplanes ovalisporus]